MRKISLSGLPITALIACALAIFALSVLLHAYDNDPIATESKSRPGSYSVSALGCAGFFDTLRRLDRPALRSVGNTLGLVGYNGTLIVAEPDLYRLNSSEGIKLMQAPRVLLVLPKWRGKPDENKPAWIDQVEPEALINAKRTLSLVDGRSDVFRDKWPAAWKINLTGLAPDAPNNDNIIQLIRSKTMRPVVGNDDGILLGEVGEGENTVWVLADPDIMANHGLGKGENAAFMVTVVDMLRLHKNSDAGAPIVFDETVHGFLEAQSTPLKLLFRFPFVIATILVCCAAALLTLAGANRFGPALNPKPELDFGKKNLIGNGARLLDYAGHHALILKRYISMTVRQTAYALHAPSGLDEARLAAWLDNISKTRKTQKTCAEILRAAAAVDASDPKNLARLFECVRDIHNWKGEILHEPSASKQHRK